MKTIIIVLFSFLFCASLGAQEHIDRHLHKGIEAFNKQEFDVALKHFEKELHHNPNEAEAYYYLGLIKNSKNLGEGIAEFSKAITLKSDYDEAYNARANCQIFKGDYPNALIDLNTAINIDSSNFNYFFNRSDVKVYLKDFMGGINDAKKALKLDPMTPSSVFGTLAKGYAGIGNYSEALKFATEFIQFEQFPSSYIVRGDIKFAMNDFKGALEDYQKGNDPDLDGGNTYVKIAETKFALEDPKGACKVIDKALELGIKVSGSLLAKCGK